MLDLLIALAEIVGVLLLASVLFWIIFWIVVAVCAIWRALVPSKRQRMAIKERNKKRKANDARLDGLLRNECKKDDK